VNKVNIRKMSEQSGREAVLFRFFAFLAVLIDAKICNSLFVLYIF